LKIAIAEYNSSSRHERRRQAKKAEPSDGKGKQPADKYIHTHKQEEKKLKKERESPQKRRFPVIETIKTKSSHRLSRRGYYDDKDDEYDDKVDEEHCPRGTWPTQHNQLIKAAAIWISQTDKTGLFRGNVLSCQLQQFPWHSNACAPQPVATPTATG